MSEKSAVSWERLCTEIEAEPRLSAVEERALWNAWLDGNDRAREKLIRCTLRYALGIASRLSKGGKSWEPGDLLGEAVQAMTAALERWDGGGSFAAYVMPRLRGSMQDYLRRRAGIMRLPAGVEAPVSLDAPDGDDGRTLLDRQAAPTVEVPLLGPAYTAQESRIMAATILRQPTPATAAEAAVILGLTEATVSRVLRVALRKRPASG